MQAVSMGTSHVQSAPVRFGRQANVQELLSLARKAPAGLKPELTYAYDMTLSEFENFPSQGPLKMMKNGREMLADSISLMAALRRQGLPEQDQPVYFVLKGAVPDDLPEHPIKLNLVRELKQFSKGPIKMLMGALGLNPDTLPDTPPPAGGYTREDARQAMQALADSPSARPVNEMLALMNILLNRTRREDFIPLEGGRFAFRMTLPGEHPNA